MKVVKFDQLEFIPASHEDPKDPGVLKKILFKKDELMEGRVQMINWAHLIPGKSFRKHYHEEMEEIFIIVSGKAEIKVNEKKFTLSKGDAILMTPGERHEMFNIGVEPVDYVVVGIIVKSGGKTVIVG